MSVEPRDLKVAELIKASKSYTEIQTILKEQGQRISNDKISEIKKMIDAGVIAFNEDGKAYEAEPRAVAEVHKEVIGVISKKAAEEAVLNAEEDYTLGRELRQYWFLKAQEKGMTLRDFVKAALITYEDYGDLSAENEQLRKISRTALEQLNTNTIQRKRLELYYRFCRNVMDLRARGLSVPQQVIVDFYSDLEYLSRGGSYPVEEVLRNVAKGETQDIDHPG